jgi:hypothetical protein
VAGLGGVADLGGVSGLDGVAGLGGTTAGIGSNANGGSAGATEEGDWSLPCANFCRSVFGGCAESIWELYADCLADCSKSADSVPPECRDLTRSYVYCTSPTGDCATREVQGCSVETQTLAACLLGDLTTCAFNMVPELEGCTLRASCGMATLVVQCDAENDGTGTSLCDCTSSGSRVGSPHVDGIGIIACANALRRCMPP